MSRPPRSFIRRPRGISLEASKNAGRPAEHLEFELRPRIDARHHPVGAIAVDERSAERIMQHIIKHLQEDCTAPRPHCTVERSINFLQHTQNESNATTGDPKNQRQKFSTSVIQRRTFDTRAVQQKGNTSGVIKRVLYREDITRVALPFRMTLNGEEDVPKEEAKVSRAMTVRMKLRFSAERPRSALLGDALAQWRVDVTLVIAHNTVNKAQLIQDKLRLFLPQGASITPMNFIKTAPWGIADHLELELEYLGDHKGIVREAGENAMAALHALIITSNESGVAQVAAAAQMRDIAMRMGRGSRPNITLKSISNQALGLTRPDWNADVLPHIDHYFGTPKVDGERAFLKVSEGRSHLIRSGEVTERGAPLGDVRDYCLLDVEYYSPDLAFVFDVMIWRGESLLNKPFKQRMARFKEAAALFPWLKEKPFILMSLKAPERRRQLEALTKVNAKTSKWVALRGIPLDGIIFTPTQTGDSDGYHKMRVMKWKPAKDLSVDFLIKRAALQTGAGLKDGLIDYYMYCGASPRDIHRHRIQEFKSDAELFQNTGDYGPVRFMPSDSPMAFVFRSKRDDLADQVGEFRLVRRAATSATNANTDEIQHTGMQWDLLRLRPDRLTDVANGNYFGNNFRVAELTWNSMMRPITIEELSTAGDSVDAGYFQRQYSQAHKAQRSYNNQVKIFLIKKYCHRAELVVDLGSGKGQDIHKYQMALVNRILFVDGDRIALSELNRRRYTLSGPHNMHVQISHADLRQQSELTLAHFSAAGVLREEEHHSVDTVVCNLALHYLMDDEKMLRNTLQLVKSMLKKSGRFIFTCMDGVQVHALLQKHAGKYDVQQVSGDVKFSIHAKYDAKKPLAPFGQVISLKLPFTTGDVRYEEHLVNLPEVARVAASMGFSMVEEASFTGKHHDGYGKLAEDDRDYVSLYSYTVLQLD